MSEGLGNECQNTQTQLKATVKNMKHTHVKNYFSYANNVLAIYIDISILQKS